MQGMSYIFKKSIPDFTVTQSFPNESGIGEYSYTLQPGVDYTYTPTQVDKFKVGQQDITIERNRKQPVREKIRLQKKQQNECVYGSISGFRSVPRCVGR